MRRLQLILLFSIWVSIVYAQVSMDFANSVEKEDTLHTFDMALIRKHKKLVKQIMQRLQQDMQQKHGARKYKIDGIFRVDSFPEFSASCVFLVDGDNGLEIVKEYKRENVKLESFCCKGLDEMSPRDSSSIKSHLIDFIDFSPARSYYFNSAAYPLSPFTNFDITMRWYEIKAYKINYGSHSMYSLHLVKRKDRRIFRFTRFKAPEVWTNNYFITADFDTRTLRIKSFKGESSGVGGRYVGYENFQIDYDEEGGAPVLKQIHYARGKPHAEARATVIRVME